MSQLFTSNPDRPLDANFHEAVRIAEAALYRYGQDPVAASRIKWLLSELSAYKQKHE